MPEALSASVFRNPAFDSDPDDRPMPPQLPDQLAHADDIVADFGLLHQVPEPVEDTQLVVSITLVDADKDLCIGISPVGRDWYRHWRRPFRNPSPTGRPCWNLIKALEAQLPLATTRPASTGRDRSACGLEGTCLHRSSPDGAVTGETIPPPRSVN